MSGSQYLVGESLCVLCPSLPTVHLNVEHRDGKHRKGMGGRVSSEEAPSDAIQHILKSLTWCFPRHRFAQALSCLGHPAGRGRDAESHSGDSEGREVLGCQKILPCSPPPTPKRTHTLSFLEIS